MKRRMFNLFSLVSLLLCAAASTAWATSHFRKVSYELDWRGHGWEIGSRGGRFVVGDAPHWQRRLIVLTRECQALEAEFARLARISFLPRPDVPAERLHDLSRTLGRADARRTMAHERINEARREAGRGGSRLAVPCAAAVAALAAAPAWSAWSVGGRLLDRRRRARAGLCGRCGYDLRASPERCPECGAPVSHPS